MAHQKGKEQPPAYEDYHASTTAGGFRLSAAPNHSTYATKLSKTGTYTISQYLELTFSVMVRCRGKFEPIVIGIDEDYDTLLAEFDYIFSQMFGSSRSLELNRMTVIWEKGWKESCYSIGSREIDREWHSTVRTGNITAMLRLLKAESGGGGMSYIDIS